MKHSFHLNPLSGTCSECTRSEADHSDSAQCEACSNIGPCEVLGDMLLCETCYEHDIELAKQDSPVPSNDRETRITQLVNTLGKEIPTDARAYFVGEVTSIVDIERKLIDEGLSEADARLKCAQIVESHITKFRNNLFAVKQLELELKTKMVSDQKYLNQIVPQLREEEREKFKAYDITYKPTAVTTATASKPRMSASDKALESMAKMLGISVEQARMSLQGAVKSTLNVNCTCAETPGCCKVHP